MTQLTWVDRIVVVVVAATVLQPFLLVVGQDPVFLPYSAFECTSYNMSLVTNMTDPSKCHVRQKGALTEEDRLCPCDQWQQVDLCSVDEYTMDEEPYLYNTKCGNELFAPRFGHAVTTFKDKIWITGGKTVRYQRWDLRYATRLADVWKSDDGRTWAQVKSLNGEYDEQNADAKFPGRIAPWWERFGHSLDTVDFTFLTVDGFEEKLDNYSAMVLAGGYAPDPKNDVWVSEDGSNWLRVHACPSVLETHISCKPAPWSPRAWHATAIFRKQLWVLGGSPLNNEVWAGSNLTKSVIQGETLWNMNWDRYGSDDSVAWSPRAGLAAASQFQQIIVEDVRSVVEDVRMGVLNDDLLDRYGTDDTENSTIHVEYLYVFGGFAGWPKDDERWDGERARNDVYRTEDGRNWTRLDSGGAPWSARAYHSVVTWNANKSTPWVDVTQAAVDDATHWYMLNKGFQTPTPDFQYIYNNHRLGRVEAVNEMGENSFKTVIPRFKRQEQRMAPRMWLSGGSYSGQGGGHKNLDESKPDRPDLGNNFVREMDGYVDLWWTRNGVDWFSVTKQEGEKETLYSSSQCFKTEEHYLAKWGHQVVPFKPQNSTISALYFVAGDTTKTVTTDGEELGGQHVRDVFMSSNGILCDIDGRTCSGNGICAPTFSPGDPRVRSGSINWMSMLNPDQDKLWTPEVGRSRTPVHPDWEEMSKNAQDRAEENERLATDEAAAEYINELLKGLPPAAPGDGILRTNYTYADTTGLYRFYPRENKGELVTWGMYQGCLCFSGYVGEYCEGVDPSPAGGARSFLAAASWLTALVVLLSTVVLELPALW